MKLHLTTAEHQYLITAYDKNYIEINRERHANNLIVMPGSLSDDWHTGNFQALTADHFTRLLSLNPEVVLLGTGEKHHFLHPKIYHELTNKGIPLECMTTAAACRTYNILMSEGRNVAAALILG